MDSSTRRNTTAFPFNPNPDKYKPAPTGGTAASYELDVTDQSFRFPQTWRSNIGVDRGCPWGLVGSLDYIYNRDLNAPVYVQREPAGAEGTYTGVDNRQSMGRNGARRHAGAGHHGRASGVRDDRRLRVGLASTRLNNTRGQRRSRNAYVIKNQSENRSWNLSGALTKNMTHGFSFKGGFNYGVSRSLVEPSSTAATSWGAANPIVTDPNNPALAYSQNSPGKRVFLVANYSRSVLRVGSDHLLGVLRRPHQREHQLRVRG